MKKLLSGVGALIALGTLLIGIPWLLVIFAGNPFPTGSQWEAMFSLTPDYGNVILLTKILPLLVWVFWAAFAIPFLVELFAAMGGRSTRKRLPAFRLQQKLSASLIGAVVVMFAGGASALAAPVSASADVAAVQTVDHVADSMAAGDVVQDDDAEDAAPVDVPADAVKPQLVHSVVEGDTLWDLADTYLGDGERYTEIFDANRGPQNDGRELTDPDLILPGWEMTIPTVFVDAPAPPAPAVPAEQTPVDAGTTTGADEAANADAAGAESDAAAATPEAVEAHVPEPMDGSLTIEPPATYDAVDQAAVAPVDVTEPPRDETTTDAAPGPVEASDVDAAEAAADDDFTVPLMTVGGIGGVLAAGLLTVLGARRLQQRRRRAKGERIALPSAEVADLEFEMRMVESPRNVSDVDDVLRTLQVWAEDTHSALPELLAVRVTDDDVSLFLTEPGQLPTPFESMHADGTTWRARRDLILPPTRSTVSPYPALATFGVDAQGGSLLLDLEQIGALSVTGDETTARGMLDALACEFATNPWSDQIQVTLVGMSSTLAHDLDRFRIHEVADAEALVRNLRADMEQRRSALDSWGVGGVLEARTRANEIESWAPHIVIMGAAPVGSVREELAELVARMPRLGIATVAQGPALIDGAIVDIDSPELAWYRSGGALPPLPFQPQILAGAELERTHELFEVTGRDSQPADLEQEHRLANFDASIPPIPQFTQPAETSAGEASVVLPYVDDLVVPLPEFSPAPTSSPIPNPDELITDVPQGVDPATVNEPVIGDTTDTEQVPDWPAPYIRLLGPVDALHIADMEAMPGRGIEFLAFLLLQESSSVPGSLVQSKMWSTYSTDNNNARQLATRIRAALGHDPDGNPLLPEGRSGAGFSTHKQMRTDWHDFCALIGPDLSKTSNENLIRAIRLVRGIPFDGIQGTRRGWWSWRGAHEENMRAAILDAADELTHRALNTGQLGEARLGAKIAQATDPLNEAGWRLELETAISAGNAAAFTQAFEAMLAMVGDEPLDEETQQLIDDAYVKIPGLAS